MSRESNNNQKRNSFSFIQNNYFLYRLKSLQSLCSLSSNDSFPNSLLFLPGPDGRHNKGSLFILKYLFQGSIGKDLYDGYLDDHYEALEEIILLIQASSISIFWRYFIHSLSLSRNFHSLY